MEYRVEIEVVATNCADAGVAERMLDALIASAAETAPVVSTNVVAGTLGATLGVDAANAEAALERGREIFDAAARAAGISRAGSIRLHAERVDGVEIAFAGENQLF